MDIELEGSKDLNNNCNNKNNNNQTLLAKSFNFNFYKKFWLL